MTNKASDVNPIPDKIHKPSDSLWTKPLNSLGAIPTFRWQQTSAKPTFALQITIPSNMTYLYYPEEVHFLSKFFLSCHSIVVYCCIPNTKDIHFQRAWLKALRAAELIVSTKDEHFPILPNWTDHHTVFPGHCLRCLWCGQILPVKNQWRRHFCCLEHNEAYVRKFDWQSLRYQTFQRDNYTCQKCKKVIDRKKDNELHCDHIIALCNGGSWYELSNLQTLCYACHKKKTKDDVAQYYQLPIKVSKKKKKVKKLAPTNTLLKFFPTKSGKE